MTDPGSTSRNGWWETDGPDLVRCTNCDAARNGPFCSNCGARHTTKRLTVLGLVRELPARFLSLDRGFIKTFVDLSLRPGHVAFNYVRGQRRRYVSPLPYFLVAATVQLLALISLRPLMITHISKQLGPKIEEQPELWESLLRSLGPEPLFRLSELIVDMTRSFYSYLWILFCLAFAVAFWIMRFAGSRRFNLAEWIVFSVYSFGHILLVTGLLNPIAARLVGFGPWTIVIWLSYLFYLTWSAIQFAKGKWYTVICTAVALGFALMAYTLAFWIALGIRIVVAAKLGAAP